MHFPYCVAIFEVISLVYSIKVSTRKMHRKAESACVSRMCKRALTYAFITLCCVFEQVTATMISFFKCNKRHKSDVKTQLKACSGSDERVSHRLY